MRVALACVLFGAVACGDSHAVPDALTDGISHDGPVDAAMIDADLTMPATLFDTGLCVDRACTQINAGIYPYTPQFGLWADGATKRRWIYLPPGTKIDTTDMDHWVFPQGTKLWKEFTRDSTRVETRLVYHFGPGNTLADWFYGAYQWNATNDDTTLANAAGVQNANGTPHDIPPKSACRTCHENLQPSRVLGFAAIQLDKSAATGEVALADAITNGWLTTNPTGASPHFPVPGTVAEKAALGYLHANCGHCHNPNSKVFMDIGITMQLRMTIATLGSAAMTPPYTTAVNVNAMRMIGTDTKIIAPHDATHSVMIDRFESMVPGDHMPALGSEVMDPTGQTVLRTWIDAMP
ncbi:MAG: hypothetical protein JWO36_999 [Myxococcales bacterium]|nr:hypothetical protein [Myxococcales bacterium]